MLKCKIKPRRREVLQVNLTNVVNQTVQCDWLADLPSRGVSSTVMLSRQSHGKRKDEEKLPQTKNVATVDDFEEAREVMSGENSNLPVKRSFRESIQGKYRNGRSNKIRDFKVRPCVRSKSKVSAKYAVSTKSRFF